MARKSAIEWTDATWNPAWGCTKVSPGCTHCYAERVMASFGREFRTVARTKWQGQKDRDPRLWKEPTRIFTLSMGDFFHEACDPWRDEWWEVIRQCPQHQFLILTKRPERILANLPRFCFHCGLRDGKCHCDPFYRTFWDYTGCEWPNVWLGTSVENQKYANERIPMLTMVPARVHFLSCEPLLGPLDFAPSVGPDNQGAFTIGNLLRHIEWVIAGGESGSGFRRMETDWVRHIRDRSVGLNIPFFFKQWGGTTKCRDHNAWGCRVLDGRTWDESPKV